METCYELPQVKRLSQSFRHQSVRELDSETTSIVERDHLSDRAGEPAHPLTPHPSAAIPTVSQQAATLRQGGAAASAASGAER